MFKRIIVGDITDKGNRADIIIGMNSELKDVRGIGLPFVKNVNLLEKITLGSVLSFNFDRGRSLHMLICHNIGPGGWEKADQYVRYGMDYLWYGRRNRGHSIVQIGTGRVGIRDGADEVSIRTAMATSFLPVTLFIFPDGREQLPAHAFLQKPSLVPFRLWTPQGGEEEIRIAA